LADAELVELGKREVEQIGFARGADVRDACVLRMPNAYPAYFGSYDRFEEIRRWISGVPNLFCIGRNGMHRYNNQDHSMLTAMMAVDAIADGSEDDAALWKVNLEAVYGENGS
jgi:protoporphyrinogen oxidase